MANNKTHREQVLDAFTRNPGRDAEAAEVAVQLDLPVPEVLLHVGALIREGKLVQREWPGGGTVYGIDDGTDYKPKDKVIKGADVMVPG